MPEAPCTYRRSESVDGFLTVETVGLTEAGHRELQMIAVPEALVPVAERYLGELAFYATQKKAIEPDETIGVPTHFGANFARLIEGRSIGDAIGDAEAAPLRVIDVMDDAPEEAAPMLVLATELFEEAFQRYQRGEMQTAVQLLHTSIDTYPGSESARDLGVNFNNENFRSHLLLYTLSQDPQHLDHALRRSANFQLQQLGAPLELLQKLLSDPERLREQADLVRKVRLATWDHMTEENPEGLSHPVAPLPQPHLHTGPDGALLTALSVVPMEWADTFYRGPGRRAVEAEDALDLVVDVLSRYRDSMPQLVVKVHDGAMMWSATEAERGPLPPPLDRAAGVEHLITSILAEIGLLATAGLSPQQRRAWFELDEGSSPSEEDRARVSAFMQKAEAQLVEIVRASQQAAG